MNNRLELRGRLKRELQMVTTSTVFTDTTLNDALDDAYLWGANRHAWPSLEKAIGSLTIANDYYYDYPAEFLSDSIFKVTINEEEYYPKNFEDWLRFKKENPNRTDEKLFASYGRQVFFFPTPTVANLEIIEWGSIQPETFSSDSSKTIFSDSEESLNEGIMRKALSDLLGSKSKFEGRSNTELIKAQAILDAGFARIQKRKYRYQRKDAPFFAVPDLFPPGNSNRPSTGNFTFRRS